MCTRAPIHMHTCALTHTCTHPHRPAHVTHTCAHTTCTHVHLTHAPTHMYTCASTHVHPHTCASTHTHTRAPTRTHAHMHAPTHMHTCTHTHARVHPHHTRTCTLRGNTGERSVRAARVRGACACGPGTSRWSLRGVCLSTKSESLEGVVVPGPERGAAAPWTRCPQSPPWATSD